MKTLMWVIGKQRAGKTTFSNVLSAFTGIKVLNIGENIRNTFDVTSFVKEESVYAVPSLDDYVIRIIKDTIDKFEYSIYSTLVIDSSPRNERQLNLVCNYQDFNNVLVIVDELESKRRARFIKKFGLSAEKDEYWFRREKEELLWLNSLINHNNIYIFNSIINIGFNEHGLEEYNNISKEIK